MPLRVGGRLADRDQSEEVGFGAASNRVANESTAGLAGDVRAVPPSLRRDPLCGPSDRPNLGPLPAADLRARVGTHPPFRRRRDLGVVLCSLFTGRPRYAESCYASAIYLGARFFRMG